MSLRVICERDAFVFTYREGSYNEGAAELMQYHAEEGFQTVRLSKENPYRTQLCYFSECVRNKQKPERGNPREAKRALEIALSARRSMETNESVTL
jgi:hypothetical protein